VAVGLCLVFLFPFAFFLLPSLAQQVHRNGFETNATFWTKGSADVAYEELTHTITNQGPHEGQRCEHIKINAGQGKHVYYQYPTAHAPVSDELSVSVWVKSNRTDIQLLARIALPRTRHPQSQTDYMTTLVRGDIYRGPPNRWKRLELGRVVKLAREQQQLMQAQFGKEVQIDFTDAFVDTVLLNVYGGPGVTETWIDALEIGPVQEPPRGSAVAVPVAPGAQLGPARHGALVEFKDQHLKVDDRRFFFRGIRHTNTPIEVLRAAGFNTFFCEYNHDPAVLQKAVDNGFLLVPNLPVTSEDARLTSLDGVGREVRRFPFQDHVLFWSMGNALSYEQTSLVSRSAQAIHTADPHRPLGGDAWDGLPRYSGNSMFNVLGIHRWPLGSMMQLTGYRDWMEQRRRLANPGTFMWSWIQTHTPEWYTSLLYDRSAEAGFEEPIGPQAEQIRLLTYVALGVGCRGLAYWSDRFLADSHQGRDRLLAVALLNQEIDMLEPLLVGVEGDPKWIPTTGSGVEAAVLRSNRNGLCSTLVLPMWLGLGGQYVPGQAAAAKVSIIVPLVPQSSQAWEVTPGEVRALPVERVPGGMKVTLPDFGLTTAIVFTSDMDLIVRFQRVAWMRRQLAAQWTYELAVQELDKAVRLQEELEKANLTVVDAQRLLTDARERLSVARGYWDNRLFSEAYREAQRSMRPLRILMRAQWEKATKDLIAPVSSPYAVSYFTLPRHLQFMDRLKRATPAANLLPGGGFETVPALSHEAWVPQDVTLDEVELIAQRVSEIEGKPAKRKKDARTGQMVPVKVKGPDGKEKDAEDRKATPAFEGKLCLKLQIRPKNKELPPTALERTFLAINSPAVRLPPGSLVRISGWMAVMDPITASPDGALFYDSAGGEPLAIRRVDPTGGWWKVTLFRRVPASGLVSVTLALTGLGTVYFDDVKIEPMIWGPEPPPIYPPTSVVSGPPR